MKTFVPHSVPCRVLVSMIAAGLVAGPLAGCGGGDETVAGSAAPAAAPAAATAKALSLVTTADHRWGRLSADGGTAIEVFRNTDGTVAQAVYSNPSGASVRVFYDADGLPERIVDQASGTTVAISRPSAERIDVRSYAADGSFTEGFAILLHGGQPTMAPILGTPAVSGQLTGQVSGGRQSASFSVLASPNAGLGPETAVSAQALALADAFAQATSSAASASGTARALAGSALATQGIDQRALWGGLAFGLIVGAASLPVAGLISGAMFAYGLQRYLLPVMDGVRGIDDLENLPNQFQPLLDGMNNGASPLDGVQAALNGGGSGAGTNVVARAFDALRDSLGTLWDARTLPTFTDLGHAVDTAVSGFGVDQQGTAYSWNGMVSANGQTTLAGTPGDGGAPIAVQGTLNGNALQGSASGRLGSATVTGNVNTLGRCAQLQQSGGQGTFSYAFDAGATTGSMPFFRDAYSIPDGFRVFTPAGVLYDTGGLVSGAATVTLSLTGSRTVFVTVNAPNSGTAWEFTLGCPV